MTGKTDAAPDLPLQITQYLVSGGLFNPELADHEKVRDLLIACRVALTEHRQLNQLRSLIANDAYAISFQSLGQYRTALLKAIDQIKEQQ